MKLIQSTKIIVTLIATLTFMLILKSCKKVETNSLPDLKEQQAAKDAMIKSIHQQYGNNIVGGTVYNINKQATAITYKNEEGKMVSLYNSNTNATSSSNNTNRNCNFNCTNTTNPANLHISYTLNYIQRYYTCESYYYPPGPLLGSPSASTVTVSWRVSVPFSITNLTGPKANQLATGGSIKFDNSNLIFPVTIDVNYPNPDLAINNLGTDPNCTQNTLYDITYKIKEVPDIYFQPVTVLSANLNLANDCSLVGNYISSGFVAGPSFSQNAYLPCNRIDKMFVGGGNSSYIFNNSGNSLICLAPGFTWISPDQNQYEYRKINNPNSDNWVDQTSSVYWGLQFTSGQILPVLDDISNGVGIMQQMIYNSNSDHYLVRYRNVTTGSCGIIYNLNPDPTKNPPPGVSLANADWGNPALWYTEKW